MADGRRRRRCSIGWRPSLWLTAGRPKHLHRLILLSSVYRQSSQASPQAAAADGDNELLWRFRPHRLDAEADPRRHLVGHRRVGFDRRRAGLSMVFEPNPTSYVKVYDSATGRSGRRNGGG